MLRPRRRREEAEVIYGIYWKHDGKVPLVIPPEDVVWYGSYEEASNRYHRRGLPWASSVFVAAEVRIVAAVRHHDYEGEKFDTPRVG